MFEYQMFGLPPEKPPYPPYKVVFSSASQLKPNLATNAPAPS